MAEVSSVAAMTVVLVHGGFVDGSGWEGVYKLLRQDGYRVSIVQHPTISLTDDVAATTRIVHAQNGPVMLVGHSYGGVVITEAGNDAQVAGLVYIAAFAPDRGESVSTLIKDPHRVRPSHRSCRRRTATSASTRRSSPPPSRLTWTPTGPRSWPTPRSRGAWARSAARSASRRGRPSRVGTWSPPTTG